MNVKQTIVVSGILAIAAAVMFGAAATSFTPQKVLAQDENATQTIVEQKTAESAPDPLPGHQTHQAVLVLPPRSDGSVYDGDISWVASKQVEIVILHPYNSTGVDSAHGEVLNAPFGGGKVAISLFRTPSNTIVQSGSFHFTGSAVAFHTLSGQKFTVTYSVKATVNPPSNQ
jgi:hypothetical protein